MDFSHLHFSHPIFLWALMAVPFISTVYFIFYRMHRSHDRLEKFIDPHLLPHLLLNKETTKRRVRKHLILWNLAWVLLAVALAGPRWSFREIETFSKDQSIVILLDLSESMNATDIKPSRLIRAKQKIEDLLNQAQGVKMGLIAFAADPHMITPMTDDAETVRSLLSSLDTALIYIQGSKLAPALDMASVMLDAEPGNNKAIWIVSDGGFEDASAIKTAKKIADKGIVIHGLGIGTVEGGPLADQKGHLIKKNGTHVISKLERDKFSEISKIGNGRYFEVNHPDINELTILQDLDKRAETQMELGKKNKFWDEHFYLFILPVVPVFLCWFSRGALFAFIILLSFSMGPLQAELSDYFKNKETLGKEALEAGNFQKATQTFKDPYRKGIACYRAGQFAEAEELFRLSNRPEVAASAAYNLGNALVQQQKYEEAVAAYENAIAQYPDHTKAKENLEAIKKLLEQQKQKQEQEQPDDKQKQDQSKKDQKDQKDQKEQKGQKDQKDKQGQKDQKNNKSEDKKENSKPDSSSESQAESEQSDDKGNEEEQKSEGQSSDQESDQSENEDKERKDQDPASGKSDVDKKDSEKGQESTEARKETELHESGQIEEDLDADMLLNRIENDPKDFLKNKFYFESKKKGTTEGLDPW